MEEDCAYHPPPQKKIPPSFLPSTPFFISPSPSGTNHLATTLMGLVVTLFFPPSLPSSRLLSFLSQVHPRVCLCWGTTSGKTQVAHVSEKL